MPNTPTIPGIPSCIVNPTTYILLYQTRCFVCKFITVSTYQQPFHFSCSYCARTDKAQAPKNYFRDGEQQFFPVYECWACGKRQHIAFEWNCNDFKGTYKCIECEAGFDSSWNIIAWGTADFSWTGMDTVWIHLDEVLKDSTIKDMRRRRGVKKYLEILN